MKINLPILLLLFVTTTTLAQSVYSWKDENGVTQFGDMPQNRKATVVDIGTINSYGTDHQEQLSPPLENATQKQPKIVMYSAVWCGVCKKAKAYFTKNNVHFTEYDVETNVVGKRFYAKQRKKSVPIFLIDGNKSTGFSTTTFNKLLSLK